MKLQVSFCFLMRCWRSTKFSDIPTKSLHFTEKVETCANFIIQKRFVLLCSVQQKNEGRKSFSLTKNLIRKCRKFSFFFSLVLVCASFQFPSQNAIHILYHSSCLLNEKQEKLLHFISQLCLDKFSEVSRFYMKCDASEGKDYAIALRH